VSGLRLFLFLKVPIKKIPFPFGPKILLQSVESPSQETNADYPSESNASASSGGIGCQGKEYRDYGAHPEPDNQRSPVLLNPHIGCSGASRQKDHHKGDRDQNRDCQQNSLRDFPRHFLLPQTSAIISFPVILASSWRFAAKSLSIPAIPDAQKAPRLQHCCFGGGRAIIIQ
jgi:hypothetical protein